jgi:hypothetical protein
LTFLEARRALRRAQLNHRIDVRQTSGLLRAVAELESRCRVLAIDDAVWARAEGGFPVEHVATLDALHLASAWVYQAAVGPLAIATCDAKVRANALALGMEVVP